MHIILIYLSPAYIFPNMATKPYICEIVEKKVKIEQWCSTSSKDKLMKNIFY